LGGLKNDRKLKTIETVLGSLPGVVAGLALVWLLGVAIGRLPFEGFSNSVSDSRIVQQLTRTLPPVPAVFAMFDRQVDPNSQPYVFVQPKPQAGFDYSATDVQTAESKAATSLVRITGFGCGGIISASGFVVDSGLVATNAHVIAGVERPIIKYKGDSYEGVPVYFDAALDLAILRVQKLNAPSLTLAREDAAINTTVAVLGYPGGDYRVVPGIVRDTLAVSARSIYDQGASGRGIYEVQTHVNYGNSGGPIVLGNGQVAGILFSRSISFPGYAYALTSSHIATALHQAKSSHQRVSTGACMVD
jgi:S1-C subfamily serine protease